MSLLLTPLTLPTTGEPASVPAYSQTIPAHATTSIKAIPSAVFGRILSFLPGREITHTLHNVCKDWRNLSLVNDGCLDLSGLPNLSDSDLKTILDKASGTRITSINLSSCSKITDAGLAHLSNLTSLSLLDLGYCRNITDAGLAHLSKLTLLSLLDLRGCTNITDAGLAHLSKLTLLSLLDLGWCSNITDAGLAHLVTLTSLSSLNLYWCNNITDAGLAHLSKLTSLNSLMLAGCENITDAGLAHLSKLTSLRSLNLSVCTNITDAGLAHLVTLSSLSSLYLGRCDKITDAGLAHLVTLTSLSLLLLNNCRKITDAGLAHLSKLKPLSSLHLMNCRKITDAGLAHLSKLTLLSALGLYGCKNITDAGLAHLVTPSSPTLLQLNFGGVSAVVEKAFKAKLIPVELKDAAFRDKMDYYIYMLASQPKGGDEWGKKNRYVDFDRLKLAQGLAALKLSRPELFKELSIDSLLDLINQLSSTDQIDQSLHKLPEETRNAIFGQVYQLAPEPKGGDQWGEKHRFDDLARFRLAVIEVIKSRVLPSK